MVAAVKGGHVSAVRQLKAQAGFGARARSRSVCMKMPNRWRPPGSRPKQPRGGDGIALFRVRNPVRYYARC